MNDAVQHENRTPPDPTSWGSGISHVLTIPDWLGGARLASYIVRHAWTRRLILWPIIKLKGLP